LRLPFVFLPARGADALAREAIGANSQRHDQTFADADQSADPSR